MKKSGQLLEGAQRSNDLLRVNQLLVEVKRLEGNLQKAGNDAQAYTQKYKTQIPATLKQFEQMENERIDLLKGSFLTFTRVQEEFAKAEVMSNIQQMKQAVSKINPASDVTQFIAENKNKKSVLDRLDDFTPEYGSTYGSANFKSSLPERTSGTSGGIQLSNSSNSSSSSSNSSSSFGKPPLSSGFRTSNNEFRTSNNELSVSGPISSKGTSGFGAGFSGGAKNLGGSIGYNSSSNISKKVQKKEEEKKKIMYQMKM